MSAEFGDLRRRPRLARALRLVRELDELTVSCPECKMPVGMPCLPSASSMRGTCRARIELRELL